jgi:hypothetical protein
MAEATHIAKNIVAPSRSGWTSALGRVTSVPTTAIVAPETRSAIATMRAPLSAWDGAIRGPVMGIG